MSHTWRQTWEIQECGCRFLAFELRGRHDGRNRSRSEGEEAGYTKRHVDEVCQVDETDKEAPFEVQEDNEGAVK